jgi:tRNA-2-methylthio-N6-dimethylallyladenosine synthase
MNRFFIKTFGCQMNKDDSERIAGLLVAGGYQPAAGPAEADLVIFNTCCIRKNADNRLYGQVAALKALKAQKPELIIAVGGCLAQLDGELIQEKSPHVDVVFGTHNVADLPQLVASARAGQKACEIVTESVEFTGDLPAVRKTKWHAWLPITVGCDNFCSYCIVPHVRGREKSRDLSALLDAARELVADGVSEITLLGQNVNSYGRDLYGAPKFADLLKSVSAVEGLSRVRFTTSHPKDLTDGVIELVAERDNLCPHFHLPLQAGSDRILTLMKRQYDSGLYLALVDKIRRRVPDVSITTDIIVGFPSETEDDFDRTLEVMEAAEFDQAFTFIYSPRPGTPAAADERQIPHDVKSARFARLAEVQNRLSLTKNRALLGKRFPAFIEGLSKKDHHRLAARTAANKLVHLDGPDELIGSSLDVDITEAFSWFLLGKAAGAGIASLD